MAVGIYEDNKGLSVVNMTATIKKRRCRWMKYYIIAEVREDHPNLMDNSNLYNDYVSRKSMQDLCNTLNCIGYECVFLGGISSLITEYKKHPDVQDCIFINYNYGLPAAFKRVQSPAILELMHAKYSGADPFVALLVNDKEYTKRILRAAGFQVPPGILSLSSDNLLELLNKIKLCLPLVVKPNCEGSSLGITKQSLCKDYLEAYQTVCKLIPEFREVIIEEYISGYECTVWLIGNPGDFQLVAPLLVSDNGIYFFEEKIFTMSDKANHTREYSLPEKILGAELTRKLNNIATEIFKELGLRDYARLDFRISGSDIYFIEANALPVFSKTSEIGHIMRLYNISYEDICRSLISSINNRLMG